MSHPSRDNWYQAQTAYMIYLIASGLGGKGSELEMEDLLLQFNEPDPNQREEGWEENLTEEEFTGHAIASWMARVGMPGKEIRKAVEDAMPRRVLPLGELRLENDDPAK